MSTQAVSTTDETQAAHYQPLASSPNLSNSTLNYHWGISGARVTSLRHVKSIGEFFWNEVSVEEAYKKIEGPLQGVHVCVTAKVTSKKVTWKYIQDEKHWFVLNTPVPDPCSCVSMLKGAVKEDFEFLVEFGIYRLPPRP